MAGRTKNTRAMVYTEDWRTTLIRARRCGLEADMESQWDNQIGVVSVFGRRDRVEAFEVIEQELWPVS